MDYIFSEMIQMFQDDLQAIEGIYVEDIVVYGSTVTGDYIEGRGDIDFLVFLKNELTKVQIADIFSLHEKYRNNQDLFAKLEGTYYTLKSQKDIISGIYIGTSRSGWKAIDYIVHDNIEQGMILNDYRTLTGKIELEKLFSVDWKLIDKEINENIKESLLLSKKLNDVEFNIYIIQTLARCLFTRKNNSFTSKSKAIAFLSKYEDFQKHRVVLERLQSIRYPYSASEVKSVDLKESNEIILELVHQLTFNRNN